jgi:transcriptional regulator with XRE-family HTH domain
MELLQEIGERIRMVRLAKKLSQENVAEMLGLTVTSYGKIEQGKSDISISRLQDIAKTLDIDMGEILRSTSGSVFISCTGTYQGNGTVTVQSQQDEITIIKSTLAEILRRLEALERLE